MSDFEKFLAREARRAHIRRDIVPAALLILSLAAAFFLGRCSA